ncbi:MAG: hypothetical protein ACTS78_03635 [Arsenophonus sp. NC-WZS1-MAG3]
MASILIRQRYLSVLLASTLDVDRGVNMGVNGCTRFSGSTISLWSD